MESKIVFPSWSLRLRGAIPLTTVPVLFQERECWLNDETPGVDQGLILVSSIIAQRILWISEVAWLFRQGFVFVLCPLEQSKNG